MNEKGDSGVEKEETKKKYSSAYTFSRLGNDKRVKIQLLFITLDLVTTAQT